MFDRLFGWLDKYNAAGPALAGFMILVALGLLASAIYGDSQTPTTQCKRLCHPMPVIIFIAPIDKQPMTCRCYEVQP